MIRKIRVAIAENIRSAELRGPPAGQETQSLDRLFLNDLVALDADRRGRDFLFVSRGANYVLRATVGADGKLVQGWGGPGEGYDWPDAEHGIFVDHRDHVWITGSSPVSTSLTKRSDDMLLKFTNKGKFPETVF